MDDSYCLLPERISEQFSEIDSDIVMDLAAASPEYTELKAQMEELKRQNPVIGALLEGKGELDEHEALKEFIRTPKKILNKISFYGLRVKTIVILGVFRYAISKEQGGERYDYPTTIYEHVENLSGCSAC